MMSRVSTWRALLFYKGGSPTEIERMDYFSLRYWGELSEIQQEAIRKATKPKPGR